MFFIKDFKFYSQGGLKLTNNNELNDYLKRKVEYFSNYKNYSSKDEMLKLLDEINLMIKHDIATAKFNFDEISDLVGFNFEDEKEIQIYYFDLVIILGTIYYNVFDKDGNKIGRISGGTIVPFSTRDMVNTAYEEFLSAKKHENKSVFGATLIFVTLLEHDLKLITKIFYTKKLLKELEIKISKNLILLSKEENDLYLYLRHGVELDSQSDFVKKYDGYKATHSLAYEFFQKYNDFKSNDKNFYKKLFSEKYPLTLNELIVSQQFKDMVDLRFWQIIDIMFSPKKMNLRNNLAHCNDGYANTYNISVTALIYGIYVMVSNNMIFK